MKRVFHLLIGFLLLSGVSASAQDAGFFDVNGDVSGEIASNLPTSGPKKDLKPIEFVNPRPDDIFWQKVIYRVVDLREKMNFPLYYPEESGDGRQSLFTLIFRLLQDGENTGVYAYEYQDGREVFSDNYKLDFVKDVLEKYEILNEPIIDSLTNEVIGYSVEESDIPNREVLKFYMKEVWFFNKHTSIFDVKIIAVCPIMQRETDIGMVKYPLFWVPFDMLRPYLAQQEVLISDRNNGARISLDDLFIIRRFGSYIFKESNVQNRNLLEYNSTAADVHKEQAYIKENMFNFEQDLWEY